MNALTVFISYSHDDLEYARRLHSDLKDVGLNPWLDKEDIMPGQDWDNAITEAIQCSRFFLVLLSSRMVSRRGFVHKEIKKAQDFLAEYPEGETFVIPIRLDECEPPYSFLRGLQWVDMFPSWEDGLHKILRAMAIENARQIPTPVHRVSVIVCDFRNFSPSARADFIGERYSEHLLQSLAGLVSGNTDVIGSDRINENVEKQPIREAYHAKKNLYQVLYGRARSYNLLTASEELPPTIADAPDYHPGTDDDHRFLLKDHFGIYVGVFGERMPYRPIQMRGLLKSPYMWARYDACFIVAGSVEEPELSRYRALVRLLWITEFDERTLAFEETEFESDSMTESAKSLSINIRNAMNDQLNIKCDT